MKKISPKTKIIANNHIQARLTNKFNPVRDDVKTKDDVIQKLLQGYVYEEVLREIEIKFCSVTSLLMQGQFGYSSKAYKAAVYKGFKALLDN